MIELFTNGGVAQLGERCVRIAEVRGSNPLSSTIKKSVRLDGFFYGKKLWSGIRTREGAEREENNTVCCF